MSLYKYVRCDAAHQKIKENDMDVQIRLSLATFRREEPKLVGNKRSRKCLRRK